ncbi:hypothetical protein [Aquabacterium sp.]|uniref:hypothetical protein n=1 Tax=Aquabacterium sp. TaxID=1872578 RepID=UPI0026387ED0|nr:hypothetical protein [Aquabacterium sp.]MDD2976098.1 hypothetical protein [Aquabacterium sp.]
MHQGTEPHHQADGPGTLLGAVRGLRVGVLRPRCVRHDQDVRTPGLRLLAWC